MGGRRSGLCLSLCPASGFHVGSEDLERLSMTSLHVSPQAPPPSFLRPVTGLSCRLLQRTGEVSTSDTFRYRGGEKAGTGSHRCQLRKLLRTTMGPGDTPVTKGLISFSVERKHLPVSSPDGGQILDIDAQHCEYI